MNDADSKHLIKTGLQAFIMNNSINANNETEVVENIIATGLKRKLKKKLKKLQRENLGEEEIFDKLQKAQRKIHKTH